MLKDLIIVERIDEEVVKSIFQIQQILKANSLSFTSLINLLSYERKRINLPEQIELHWFLHLLEQVPFPALVSID